METVSLLFKVGLALLGLMFIVWALKSRRRSKTAQVGIPQLSTLRDVREQFYGSQPGVVVHFESHGVAYLKNDGKDIILFSESSSRTESYDMCVLRASEFWALLAGLETTTVMADWIRRYMEYLRSAGRGRYIAEVASSDLMRHLNS